jgi:hypothetical protein
LHCFLPPALVLERFRWFDRRQRTRLLVLDTIISGRNGEEAEASLGPRSGAHGRIIICPMCLSSRSSSRSFGSAQWLGRKFDWAAARTGQGTGVRRLPPSFSRKPMWEKLFRIRLGGLWQLCAQRMAVEPGYFRPGGDTVNQRLHSSSCRGIG